MRRTIPLHDLDRMVIVESAHVTMPALMEMVRRRIPVAFMDGLGRFLGSIQPADSDHGAARLRHYEKTLEMDFPLRTAGELVAAKIHNQRRLLQRVAANRRAEEREVAPWVDGAVGELERLLLAAPAAPSVESLRGIEGAAAHRYFLAWASLLPEDAPFVRRSTRPPLNPVNAALSFASTMIYHEMHSFLHAHGLDAALGVLHTTENGRWSLALDLMEPFRPVVAEALTLDLFSHRMLGPDHFEPRQGGVYLTRDGRAKLILQYEKRMERQFMSEFAGHRTTLRQQLENQAILFKAALDDPARFRPFRMN